jgi:hypothetical protein
MYTSDARLNVATGMQSLKVLRYCGVENDSTHPAPEGGSVMAICAMHVDKYHVQTAARPT